MVVKTHSSVPFDGSGPVFFSEKQKKCHLIVRKNQLNICMYILSRLLLVQIFKVKYDLCGLHKNEKISKQHYTDWS
jgi:hypothetical protein